MFYSLIARILATQGFFNFLWNIKIPSHLGHLITPDNKMYMGRWTIPNGWIRKFILWITGYDDVRIHWIAIPDEDRFLHNHPFDYRTFVMKGWYLEQHTSDNECKDKGFDAIAVSSTVMREKGTTATGDVNKFHRVLKMSEGGVYTLFFMKNDTNDWGFSIPEHGYMDRNEYFKLMGYDRSASE